MLKNLNKRKKKKGFTLIELVIVLAVLAIIALIAIPNFNKVRTDSKKKADLQTCETIKRATTMAIANQDMIVTADSELTINQPTVAAPGMAVVTDVTVTNLTWKNKNSYAESLKEIKDPQAKEHNSYKVVIKVDTNGVETVTVDPQA